jgi:LmbE family N-acetylglucosaminyl deacetylase
MIKLNHPQAEIYFPNPSAEEAQLARTTHLGIGAHQDDLEILAIQGILAGFDNEDKAFTGVTVTDGRGAPRSGDYADLSDDDLWLIRNAEQKEAADIGQYNAQFLLNHSSADVKTGNRESVIEDLIAIITTCQPEVIYTHNLADKHDTHVAVALSVIAALRWMGPAAEGIQLLGAEVWRGLDWLTADRKIALNVSAHPDLQEKLLQAFPSQIAGGKRYDQATLGRRRANATYFQSHHTDQADLVTYAMDLTPLITQTDLDIAAFIDAAIQSLAEDVRSRINLLDAKGN